MKDDRPVRSADSGSGPVERTRLGQLHAVLSVGGSCAPTHPPARWGIAGHQITKTVQSIVIMIQFILIRIHEQYSSTVSYITARPEPLFKVPNPKRSFNTGAIKLYVTILQNEASAQHPWWVT